jgi:hypothetical protein
MPPLPPLQLPLADAADVAVAQHCYRYCYRYRYRNAAIDAIDVATVALQKPLVRLMQVRGAGESDGVVQVQVQVKLLLLLQAPLLLLCCYRYCYCCCCR